MQRVENLLQLSRIPGVRLLFFPIHAPPSLCPASPIQVEYGVISQAGYAFSVIHSSLSAVVINFKRLRSGFLLYLLLSVAAILSVLVSLLSLCQCARVHLRQVASPACCLASLQPHVPAPHAN